MKATGVVRRIDDLGRVVIPKEIRRTLRIREGDPLEIYTDDGGVIFKKYSPMGELSESDSKNIMDGLYHSIGQSVILCDSDRYLSVYGKPARPYLEHIISNDVARVLETRKESSRALVGEGGEYAAFVCPIISDGDVQGAICAGISTEDIMFSESDIKMVKFAASVLGKMIQND